VSWKRRTRMGGDSWDQADVPLAEEAELYQLDIFDGPDVVRTLESPTPQATYTLSQQTADFGGPQWSLNVAVYQLSAVFGRGAGRSATLYY
jgi:hypothetical protein